MPNITDCTPDSSPAGIAYNLWMLLMASICLLFNICTAFACMRQAKHLNSAAFYVLANLCLAYALHLASNLFLLYLEALTGLRLYLPFRLEANLGTIGSGSATHLLLLYAANRFVCIFVTLRYDRIFTNRNTWLAIGLAWLLGIHRMLQRMIHGEQLEHCWAPGYTHYVTDATVKALPLIKFLEEFQKWSLATPTLFDILVLTKLGLERLPFSPFYRMVNHADHGYTDRVCTFMVCLATSTCHVLYVFVLYQHITNRDFDLILTVLPAVLILLFSPGYRKLFKALYFRCGTKKSQQGVVKEQVQQVHPPASTVIVAPANVGMIPVQVVPRC